MTSNGIPYRAVKEELLANPEVRAEYEALEPAFQLACLRIALGLTQAEVAQRANMKQPNIARLESGQNKPTVDVMRRVAEAMGYRMNIQFVRVADGHGSPCTGAVAGD